MMILSYLSVLQFLAVTISFSVALNSVCLEDLEERPCVNDTDKERVYFNQETGRCETTGSLNTCTTGPNSFTDYRVCTTQCECQLPPEPTPCNFSPSKLFKNFFFNIQTGSCESFPTQNGNCNANGNFFFEKSFCTTVCLCSQPADAGTGTLDIPSFFFNTKRKHCEEFTYTGKGGNANRFATRQQCSDRCLCGQPKVVGRCLAFVPSFFYNKNTNKCESFIYGGCNGNSNRFLTLGECQDACVEKY